METRSWDTIKDAGGVTHGFIAIDTKPIYGDLGTSGTWRWSGSAWTKISAADAQNLVISGPFLFADYGSNGTWKWDESKWTKISTLNPQNLVAP